MQNKKRGTFYVVATPIGNLNDITYRAVETLKSCDLIASEDTRETAKLLRHYNIEDKSQISYTDQNHERIYLRILNDLNNGLNICLVSDSGTPLISDPGYKLVKILRDNNYNVVPIPGPSAVISALSVSGLPTDKFLFLGFPPKKPGQLKNFLNEYINSQATLVFYESPYRIKKFLEGVLEVMGNRQIFIAKDISKVYEKLTYGSVKDIISGLETGKAKGEYVVLISKDLN